jgi:hypothetical protein
LATAFFENLAAGSGGGSLAKAVSFLAFSFFGLVGSFHWMMVAKFSLLDREIEVVKNLLG